MALPGAPDPRMGHLARPAHPAAGPGDLVPDPPPAAGRGGRARDPHLGQGGLAGRHRPGQRDRGVPGDAAAVAAGLVRPAGHGAGPVPVAVAGLPAPLAGRHDHRRAGPDLPGPGHPAGARQGPGRAVRGPGDGPAGVRAVAEGCSPTGPRSWPTGSGSAPAASAPPARAWSCWNWSAGTRSPR